MALRALAQRWGLNYWLSQRGTTLVHIDPYIVLGAAIVGLPAQTLGRSCCAPRHPR